MELQFIFLIIVSFITIIQDASGYFPQFSAQEAEEWLRAQNFTRMKYTKTTKVTRHYNPPHRILETSIIFPSDDESFLQIPSKTDNQVQDKEPVVLGLGSVCFLPDGNLGTCKGLKSCEAFDSDSSNQKLFRPSMIKWCDENDSKSWLICCPKTESKSEDEKLESSTPRANAPEVLKTPETSKPPLVEAPKPSPIVQVEKVNPKVSPPRQNSRENLPVQIESSPEIQDSEMQNYCGVLPNNSNSLEQYGTNWPWIVSIGRRNSDGAIDWICLGSLITKDYIITIATCLQKLPNVILIGNKPYIGHMTTNQAAEYFSAIRTVSQIISHEKFISPYLYRNIGLLQIATPIHVTNLQMPTCFPFLAGVLDIMDFKGRQAVTLGFNFPVKVDSGSGLEFQPITYKVLNNSECNRIYNLQKSKTNYRLPNGIRPDNMCGFFKMSTSICQAPGAPLIIWDSASNSLVIIGVSSGDPTCSELKRQVVSFTRVNAFSNWVRERISELPQPPPCYI